MRYEIIHIPNQYLLVVDERAKEGQDWFIRDGKLQYEKGAVHGICDCKAALAHLPLNNAPVLEGVDWLPELFNYEDAKSAFINLVGRDNYDENNEWQKQYMNSFIRGYKANPNKYSEVDLRDAFDAGDLHGRQDMQWAVGRIGHSEFTALDKEQYIQSLSHPIPIAFEADETYIDFIDEWHEPRIKRILNSQGISVWQGKYIYKTD